MKAGLSSAALGRADERTVIALAASGDDTAFTELVRRRQSWLRNLLRRLSHDQALADDLAQQVFLQAWRRLHTLRSTSAFGPWLRRLAVNTWLTHARSSSFGNSRIEPSQDPALSEDNDVASASGSDPVYAAHTQSQMLDLDRALARLPDDERVCVVLAYSEGMSHSEICAATGLPLGTVKSHIRRGAERLRVLLHGYGPQESRHVG